MLERQGLVSSKGSGGQRAQFIQLLNDANEVKLKESSAYLQTVLNEIHMRTMKIDSYIALQIPQIKQREEEELKRAATSVCGVKIREKYAVELERVKDQAERKFPKLECNKGYLFAAIQAMTILVTRQLRDFSADQKLEIVGNIRNIIAGSKLFCDDGKDGLTSVLCKFFMGVNFWHIDILKQIGVLYKDSIGTSDKNDISTFFTSVQEFIAHKIAVDIKQKKVIDDAIRSDVLNLLQCLSLFGEDLKPGEVATISLFSAPEIKIEVIQIIVDQSIKDRKIISPVYCSDFLNKLLEEIFNYNKILGIFYVESQILCCVDIKIWTQMVDFVAKIDMDKLNDRVDKSNLLGRFYQSPEAIEAIERGPSDVSAVEKRRALAVFLNAKSEEELLALRVSLFKVKDTLNVGFIIAQIDGILFLRQLAIITISACWGKKTCQDAVEASADKIADLCSKNEELRENILRKIIYRKGNVSMENILPYIIEVFTNLEFNAYVLKKFYGILRYHFNKEEDEDGKASDKAHFKETCNAVETIVLRKIQGGIKQAEAVDKVPELIKADILLIALKEEEEIIDGGRKIDEAAMLNELANKIFSIRDINYENIEIISRIVLTPPEQRKAIFLKYKEERENFISILLKFNKMLEGVVLEIAKINDVEFREDQGKIFLSLIFSDGVKEEINLTLIKDAFFISKMITDMRKHGEGNIKGIFLDTLGKQKDLISFLLAHNKTLDAFISKKLTAVEFINTDNKILLCLDFNGVKKEIDLSIFRYREFVKIIISEPIGKKVRPFTIRQQKELDDVFLVWQKVLNVIDYSPLLVNVECLESNGAKKLRLDFGCEVREVEVEGDPFVKIREIFEFFEVIEFPLLMKKEEFVRICFFQKNLCLFLQLRKICDVFKPADSSAFIFFRKACEYFIDFKIQSEMTAEKKTIFDELNSHCKMVYRGMSLNTIFACRDCIGVFAGDKTILLWQKLTTFAQEQSKARNGRLSGLFFDGSSAFVGIKYLEMLADPKNSISPLIAEILSQNVALFVTNLSEARIRRDLFEEELKFRIAFSSKIKLQDKLILCRRSFKINGSSVDWVTLRSALIKQTEVQINPAPTKSLSIQGESDSVVLKSKLEPLQEAVMLIDGLLFQVAADDFIQKLKCYSKSKNGKGDLLKAALGFFLLLQKFNENEEDGCRQEEIIKERLCFLKRDIFSEAEQETIYVLVKEVESMAKSITEQTETVNLYNESFVLQQFCDYDEREKAEVKKSTAIAIKVPSATAKAVQGGRIFSLEDMQRFVQSLTFDVKVSDISYELKTNPSVLAFVMPEGVDVKDEIKEFVIKSDDKRVFAFKGNKEGQWEIGIYLREKIVNAEGYKPSYFTLINCPNPRLLTYYSINFFLQSKLFRDLSIKIDLQSLVVSGNESVLIAQVNKYFDKYCGLAAEPSLTLCPHGS